MKTFWRFLSSLALATLMLKKCGSVSLHPVLTGPNMASLGSKVTFQCAANESSLSLTYELIKDGGQLIARGPPLQGGQPASFLLKVSVTSEGSYHCRAKTRAKTRARTGVSNSIKLQVVSPVSGTRVTSVPSPPVVYEGSRLTLSCDITQGSHVNYTWFFNRTEVSSETSPSPHLNGNKLVLEKTTPKHAGRYYCMAGSWLKDFNSFSNSAEVQVTVKAYVSTPRISFSFSKVGSTYAGNVTCWSSTGSPPVNFSLTLDDRKVGSVSAAESLVAWFSVDMVPGQDMGLARCHVKTDVQDLKSEPVILEVVPVGGLVKVAVEYLYTAESRAAGARLHCHVSAGTFPYFSWLFNDSVLPAQTHLDRPVESVHSHYALADRRRTLILTELDPHQPEYYQCRVRDSYDDSAPWLKSAAVKVQVTDRIRSLDLRPPSSTPAPPNAVTTNTEIIAIIFCCFLLLILLVGVACACRMRDLQVMKLRKANKGAA